MDSYSVHEAMEKLDELIDRVLKNETITITRDGKEIVQLAPVARPRRTRTRRQS
jgi:prevent-host-death family protein